MKKVFAVKVNTVDAYMGFRNGNKVLGYALTIEKAEELKAIKAEEIKVGQWWMDTAKNKAGEPDLYIEELGEVWE